jgi:hypothetical protein
MLEAAMVAGLASEGVDALRVGVLPTPAVAYLTAAYNADFGVMISASHNPMPDNGIKVFGPGGHKLDDDTEDRIEELVAQGPGIRPTGAEIGRVLEALDALAQHLHLPLLQADGACAVRAAQLHRRQQFGMALEEARCVGQVVGDIGFGDALHAVGVGGVGQGGLAVVKGDDSEFDFAVEDGLGRTGHQHRCVAGGPFDQQVAAAGMDLSAADRARVSHLLMRPV